MFYKFNSISQRVQTSNQAASYNPQGMTPAASATNTFQFDSSKTRAAVAPDVRMEAPSGSAGSRASRVFGEIPNLSGYKSVANFQKSWNASSSLMVWQKRGAMDSLPYIATMGLCAISVAVIAKSLLEMSFPRKQE